MVPRNTRTSVFFFVFCVLCVFCCISSGFVLPLIPCIPFSFLETFFVLSVASQLLYVLFIASLWGMVQMTQLFSVAKSTTLVNVAHGVVSGACLHTYAGRDRRATSPAAISSVTINME